MYETLPERLRGMFGEQSDEVIRLLAEERDRLNGREREFLDQIVQSANRQQTEARLSG